MSTTSKSFSISRVTESAALCNIESIPAVFKELHVGNFISSCACRVKGCKVITDHYLVPMSLPTLLKRQRDTHIYSYQKFTFSIKFYVILKFL